MRSQLACIGLGSNLGDREAHLKTALLEISQIQGCDLERCSQIYQTPPWGIEDQPEFLNMVCGLHCSRDASDLLQELQKIEEAHGRVRDEKWGSRTLDLDIICFGDLKCETESLCLPHPFFSERRFVLEPMAEIYPELVIGGLSVGEYFKIYLDNHRDQSG